MIGLKKLYPHLFQFLPVLVLCLFGFNSNGQDLHRQFSDLPCLEKQFNTIVHVPVDSLGREPIISQLEINQIFANLSDFYAPICVSFNPCELNVIPENYAYSNLQDQPIPIERRMEKMVRLFGKPNRINVFVIDSIENVTCGTGEFEGILTEDKANVFIELYGCGDKEPYQNLAHQIGHLFGLHNTFDRQAPIELVDGSNCDSVTDLICDTPADPYGQIVEIDGIQIQPVPGYFINSSCEFIYEGLDINGEYYQPDVGNIMSAYPCKCGFTRDQYLKMVEVYSQTTVKQF